MDPLILKMFYSCTIKSRLHHHLVWQLCRLRPHYRVCMAQYITKLPAIQDLYTRRCQRKALKFVRLQPP